MVTDEVSLKATDAIEKVCEAIYELNEKGDLEWSWESILFFECIVVSRLERAFADEGFDLVAGRFQMPECTGAIVIERLTEEQWGTRPPRTAAEIVLWAHRQDIHLSRDGDMMVFSAPIGVMTDEVKDFLRDKKSLLLPHLPAYVRRKASPSYMTVKKVIMDVRRISERGSAAWRELLDFAVIRPLEGIFTQQETQDWSAQQRSGVAARKQGNGIFSTDG